ncbi:MAG TPA: alpha/beta hydrolase [Reyranella sp.]|jgi:pimeloyl-ACP methyl ester carboxylesterase|nr:alpha/beta hydrolase [Reyranella sp.]
MTTASGWKRAMVALACLAMIVAATAARAEQVQIKPSLLRLNGNLEVPDGKKVQDGEVLIIVHGTLSWYGQETIAALQKNLKKHGRATLAINLSLGIDDRQRPRACDVVHDYALAGAQRELSLWIEWLYAQHAKGVDLAGFSRGGAQVAALGPELPKVRRMVLLAPAFATSSEQAENYQKAFGHPLAPELAKARAHPLQKYTVDFLTCKDAPVLGATLLDAYSELPPKLAAKTGHPTLVIVAGKDEVVPDLQSKLPSDVQKDVIEGSSHFFPDLYGEDAADIIAKFLTRSQQTAK